MKPEQEALRTLNVLNGHIGELLNITKEIKGSLADENIERFSQFLDKRQGLFARIQELDRAAGPMLQNLRADGAVPRRLADIVEQNKAKLREILAMDEECRELGEEFKRKLGAGLGVVRAKRNLRNKYNNNKGKGDAKFLNKAV